MAEPTLEERVAALELLTDDINTRLTNHLAEDEYELNMSAAEIDAVLQNCVSYKKAKYGRVTITVHEGDGSVSSSPIVNALASFTTPVIQLTARSSTVFVGWSTSNDDLTISITAKQGTFSADGNYRVDYMIAEGATS